MQPRRECENSGEKMEKRWEETMILAKIRIIAEEIVADLDNWNINQTCLIFPLTQETPPTEVINAREN